ncbi:hypothetical protein [Spiroplasma sp. SV19]|uniref:hypothetical protein n=1 Tax=Spiroplasma sp. SV19 TaxID=2570468 RepID=UPI0024B78B0A|nr:hypothetical protein [Spiroplasma sp. SV19]
MKHRKIRWRYHYKSALTYKALLGHEWPLIERLDEYSNCKECELTFKVKVKVQTEFGEQEIKIAVPYEKLDQ